MKNIIYAILIYNFLFSLNNNETGLFSISRIHYDGGGDWYANPSSLPNLLEFISTNTSIKVNPKENKVKIGDDLFYKNFYFYITGHGNIKFTNKELLILREHLENGAFLHVDDNYGLDKSFRREIKKVFPEKDWVELPPNHSIFNIYYKFLYRRNSSMLDFLYHILLLDICSKTMCHQSLLPFQTDDNLNSKYF